MNKKEEYVGKLLDQVFWIWINLNKIFLNNFFNKWSKIFTLNSWNLKYRDRSRKQFHHRGITNLKKNDQPHKRIYIERNIMRLCFSKKRQSAIYAKALYIWRRAQSSFSFPNSKMPYLFDESLWQNVFHFWHSNLTLNKSNSKRISYFHNSGQPAIFFQKKCQSATYFSLSIYIWHLCSSKSTTMVLVKVIRPQPHWYWGEYTISLFQQRKN